MSLLVIAAALWGGSFALIYWRSSLPGVARLLHAFLALPLIAALVTASVILVNALVPDAYQAIAWAKRSAFASGIEPLVAFAIYGSLPAAGFWAWLWLLRKLGNTETGPDHQAQKKKI